MADTPLSNPTGALQEPQGPLASSGDNPLYRRTFVGREQELRQLQAMFDGAASGQGSLVMVVGEPGIGKTALCEQLATHATIRGGKALVGHCYEEGSLTLPYLPFVEAIRSYVLTREPEPLRQELGSGATDVARIVSEIRDKVQVEPRAAGDPEDDRWRLYQAVTTFLRNASSVQPLLLVLEDLHWSDRGTLDFLVHLSRNLQGARIVIVGTYRDIEVDRTHPLSGILAELRRGSSFARIPLRGLTPDEVHRMINNLTTQDARWSLAEAVHRQTEGNPLFIQEVLRFMVEEGLITHEGGRWHRAGADAPEAHIPEGLRDVIGKRLSRLGPECNRLLAVASVIGRDFSLETLRPVAGTNEDQLISALEEALRVGVLEERARVGGAEYRFAHAFFRQTLYEEMSVPRRLQQHQQVARVLEAQYAARLGDHAAELADHFAHSSDKADLAKAVQYGEMAARRAMGVYAYGEAARLLEQAIEVQEVVDPEDHRTRCALLLALGEALGPGGEPLRAVDQVAEEAFRLAELLADAELASKSCQLAFESLSRYGGVATRGGSTGRLWAERADRYAEPGTTARVYAELAMGDTAFVGRMARLSRGGGGDHYRRALEEARSLGDRQTLFQCGVHMLVTGPVGDWEERLSLAYELASLPRDGVSRLTLGAVLEYCAAMFLAVGDRLRAEELWQEAEQIAARSGDPELAMRPLAREIDKMTLDGELEAALQAGAREMALADEAGSNRGLLDDAYRGLPARLYLGRWEEALARLHDPKIRANEENLSRGRVSSALCLAHLGREGEGREILKDLPRQWQDVPPPPETPIVHLLQILQLAVLLRDEVVIGMIIPLLAPRAGILSTRGRDLSCIARHLGDAAVLLGDREGAMAYYQQGLELCQKVRFRPEIALIRLGLAEILLEEDHHSEALQHLDFAIAEFREMKMQPSLERALKHKGLLRA